MKIKKVYTLMKKDIITCFTDKNILIMIAMPVLFCIFYTMIIFDFVVTAEFIK